MEHRSRGYAHYARENFDEAAAEYGEAIRLRPGVSVYYNDRGLAYLSKKDFDNAVADFNSAIRIDPDTIRYRFNRAQAHRGKKDFDKALADLDAVMRFEPDNADAKQTLRAVRRERIRSLMEVPHPKALLSGHLGFNINNYGKSYENDLGVGVRYELDGAYFLRNDGLHKFGVGLRASGDYGVGYGSIYSGRDTSYALITERAMSARLKPTYRLGSPKRHIDAQFLLDIPFYSQRSSFVMRDNGRYGLMNETPKINLGYAAGLGVRYGIVGINYEYPISSGGQAAVNASAFVTLVNPDDCSKIGMEVVPTVDFRWGGGVWNLIISLGVVFSY
jgi:tetratricopeptide (TPR) repeat protein